jgi:hypothetical protein
VSPRPSHALRPLALAGGLALAGAFAIAPVAASPSSDRYVGATACGACHPAALATWRASGHAHAARPLTATELGRRACQACHATGDAPAAPAARPGVECEACHGAGVDYALADVMRDPSLARALGLRELAGAERRAALCTSCHTAAASRAPFDVEAAWRRIAH